MSIPNLLHNMCADLSDADLNAIRKARGFPWHRPPGQVSSSETASRTSFASFFVSSIGVAEAMQSLSPEEVITLHLLHQTGEVDITFFERLYGSAAQSGRHYYGTYTQQYKPTFDIVKKNFVRRGILIMAEVKMRGDTVQMERWRFALPSEFVPYLPPLLSGITNNESGETSDYTIRKKLLQLIGGGPALPNDRAQIQIKDGTIWLDDQPFSAARRWTDEVYFQRGKGYFEQGAAYDQRRQGMPLMSLRVFEKQSPVRGDCFAIAGQSTPTFGSQ